MKKSKKFLALLLGVLVLLNLSGCDVVLSIVKSALEKPYGQLFVDEIHIYNASGEEIVGEYIREGEYRKALKETMAVSKKTVKPINSVAPIELCYIIDATEHKEVLIEYKVHVTKNVKLKKIIFGFNNIFDAPLSKLIESTNIVDNGDGNYTFSYLHTMKGGNYFDIDRWCDNYDRERVVASISGKVTRSAKVIFTRPTDSQLMQYPVSDINFVDHFSWLNSLSVKKVKSIALTNEKDDYAPLYKRFYFETRNADEVRRALSVIKGLKSSSDERPIEEDTGEKWIYKITLTDGSVKYIHLNSAYYYVNLRGLTAYTYYYEGKRYSIISSHLYPYSHQNYLNVYYTFTVDDEICEVLSYDTNETLGQISLSLIKFDEFKSNIHGHLPDSPPIKYAEASFGKIEFMTDKIFKVRYYNAGIGFYALDGDLTYNDLLVEN